MATRKDVARAAGVSVASVSRAVNNSGYVKKEVKEHILSVADSLGYNPNPIALSLQSRRTRQLILYLNEIKAPYNLQFFNGATREAYKRGYSVFLDVHCDFERIKGYLVDGVLFSLDIVAEKFLNSVGANYHIPVVTVTNDASSALPHPVHSIVIDNPKVIDTAVDYLISKGHKLIGFILPKRGRDAEMRLKLFKSRMNREFKKFGIGLSIDDLIICAEIGDEESGNNIDPPLIFQPSDEQFEEYSSFKIGYRAAEHYLDSRNPATAFLCFNDDIGYGFMRGIEKSGLCVPSDISVMGIDGIYLREWFEKKLTTVSLGAENLGAVATGALIDLLEGKKPKFLIWSSPALLEGETVKVIQKEGLS
ncbi:MAG: LacI family transcriptional regulator [Oscillospiraceae bacterium]|nr:LacI family transcriptional regulator [Oscillospiraceae bacterium]